MYIKKLYFIQKPITIVIKTNFRDKGMLRLRNIVFNKLVMFNLFLTFKTFKE